MSEFEAVFAGAPLSAPPASRQTTLHILPASVTRSILVTQSKAFTTLGRLPMATVASPHNDASSYRDRDGHYRIPPLGLFPSQMVLQYKTPQGNDHLRKFLETAEPARRNPDPPLLPADAKQVEEAPDSIFMITWLGKHRDGMLEMVVHRRCRMGREYTTCCLEKDLHMEDEEGLLAFWEDWEGGRDAAARSKMYHMLRVLRRGEDDDDGTARFEIQWVGYPATAPHTTLEPYHKVKHCLPDQGAELERMMS
ncbi:hypothetical protein JX266_013835 [Neoarthrinium moseri]|nr:hypothetical protein JX266_013835 [Neoarthrinium moseri]